MYLIFQAEATKNPIQSLQKIANASRIKVTSLQWPPGLPIIAISLHFFGLLDQSALVKSVAARKT